MDKNSRKINILISCGSYSWGGLEMISLETAMHLAKAGNNVKILCSSGSRLESEAISTGFETIPVFSKDKGIISSIIKLKKLLKKSRADVIHTNLSHDLWVLTPAMKISGSKAKLLLTKHMASGVKKKDLFHKYLYKRVDGIFAISNYIRKSVLDTCPVPEEKVHLLPVGIDLKKFNKANFNVRDVKKELKLPDGKIIIGIVGRLTPGKGHEEFLEATKIINEKHFNRVFWLVVGSASFGEDEYENNIKAYANEVKIPNIKFTGYSEDTPKMLSVIDILAFPSHNESFGRVLLEAMAFEIPVAASGNAGVVDIVINNETGVLFEPKNSLQLAEKLIKLIENDALRIKLGKAGKKRAIDIFDFDIMINKLMEYYTK